MFECAICNRCGEPIPRGTEERERDRVFHPACLEEELVEVADKPERSKTYCTQCGDSIYGTTPRTCCGCMTDHEKLIGTYGYDYAHVLGEKRR